jgi:hypothetical protein
VSKRKKYKPKYKEERPFFGKKWARRLRVIAALCVTLLLAGGSALFLLKSQTFGSLLIAWGFYWALSWACFRQMKGGSEYEAVVLAGRPWLIGCGSSLVAIGLTTYFALSDITGLLLVTIGGLSLSAVLVGRAADGLDITGSTGPPFGDVDSLR